MIRVNLITIMLFLTYHLVCIVLGSKGVFDASLSLSLSAAVCLAGVLLGGLKQDLLSPPRVLAALYLIFYPLFAAFYLTYPELGKWYHLYFSMLAFKKHVAWAVFYVTITLPIFQIGFYWDQKRLWANRGMVGSTDSHLPLERINTIMVLATCAGVAGMLLYADSLGGIDYIKQAMGNVVERKSWRGHGNLAYYPGMFLMTAPAICILAALKDRLNRKSLIIGLCLIAFALPVLVITQASREKAIVPIVLILICMYYYRKRQNRTFHFEKKALLMAMFCLIFVSFLIHSSYRHQKTSSGRPYYFQLLSDFNRIDVTVVMYFNFLKNRQSYLYGKPFLSYVVQPFVRLFGIDPIPNTSSLIGNSIFPDDRHGNPGAPLAGELFLNFGFLGYGAFFLFGILFARGYNALYKSRFEFWTVLSYVSWLYLFTFKFCIQNGISESLLFAVILIVQIWILQWLSSGPRIRW